jgi:hypothetical protein
MSFESFLYLTIGKRIRSNHHADSSAQRSMKILHPPLCPLPLREGIKKETHLSLPSPLVGEGEGEGYFWDKYYIHHHLLLFYE